MSKYFITGTEQIGFYSPESFEVLIDFSFDNDNKEYNKWVDTFNDLYGKNNVQPVQYKPKVSDEELLKDLKYEIILKLELQDAMNKRVVSINDAIDCIKIINICKV